MLAVNALGLGGTEKAVVAHARTFDRAAVEPRVVCVHAGGPRQSELEQAGVPVACAGGDGDRLAGLLAGADVVHVFRSGGREPLLPAACRAAGATLVVETNIFGQVDPTPDERLFACHLFVSRMCALRYRERTGRGGPAFHDRHRVLQLPVDVERLRALAPAREEAKRRLGLDPARPVVGRIGRDDDRKWRNLLVDMVPELLRLSPDAQVLFVGATPGKVARLHRLGVLDRVALRPTVPDEAEVAALYAACDVLVAAAEIGESGSVVLQEALALGLPIVTCSTPWVDNGQVELVEEGVNGHVAGHPRPFAEAVASLLGDADRRAAFGAAASEKAARIDVHPLTRALERLYAALAAGEPPPEEWPVPPAEVDAFAAEYARRLGASYRPETPRERREAARERLRERAGWALRAASSLDRQRAALAASMLAARLRGAR